MYTRYIPSGLSLRIKIRHVAVDALLAPDGSARSHDPLPIGLGFCPAWRLAGKYILAAVGTRDLSDPRGHGRTPHASCGGDPSEPATCAG